MASYVALLPDRGVVEVGGEDRISFLQGLVSNDVEQAEPTRAVWAALLTPQGKWLADFFIIADGARLLLDCERAQAAMLTERLTRFRLRAKATIRDLSATYAVYSAWGDRAPTLPIIVATDPRVPDAGWRLIGSAPLRTDADAAAWDRHRLALGLPDGSRDLESGTSVILEAGFDELNGVSWTKGCYMGQELTARTKYRGLVKRRLVAVEVDVDETVSPPGTPVMHDGAEAGFMRSGRDHRGLALIRLNAFGNALTCGGTSLRTTPSPWMRFPERDRA